MQIVGGECYKSIPSIPKHSMGLVYLPTFNPLILYLVFWVNTRRYIE